MSNKFGKPKSFWDLKDEDKDLTMFTITNLTLNKEDNMVSMAMKLKRKVVTELLTTYLPTILLLLITFTTIFSLGSNNVSICASLGTHAYLCVQQKVCWHTSPMRTIKMLHSSMLTCITHVCSRSYISHVGMLEHSILIAPMGQHTRGFQEQNYYVMYFIKFTWFQLQLHEI